jgi:hypothetical protein
MCVAIWGIEMTSCISDDKIEVHVIHNDNKKCDCGKTESPYMQHPTIKNLLIKKWEISVVASQPNQLHPE